MTSASLAQYERDETPILLVWIDRLALLIALAVVIARCTMLETIREPLDITPGAQYAPPRGASATTALVLSLLSVIPAILVLLRRLFDPTFIIRKSFAIIGLLLLAGWAVVSAMWAADAFLAVVSAINWLAAMTLAWAVAQLVRTPYRQRLVIGVGVGLLLVFLTQTALYRMTDLPAMREMVERDRDQILAERGWQADSFEARQFFQKITGGETIGFSASANSFAAMIVIMLVLTTGLALQRWRDREGIGWPIGLAIPVLLGVLVMSLTQSRAAFGTLTLGVFAFIALACFGDTLRRFRKPLLGLLAVALVAGVAVVVWRGSTTQTLFHDSLTFRLRYWIGSWQVFLDHPWLGVGWENFSTHYLAHRLPIASEEIRDPHNFIVRIFCELGIFGGLLLLLAVGRLMIEMTRPNDSRVVEPSAEEMPSLKATLVAPIAIALAAMALNALASIDTAQNVDYVFVEYCKRLFFAIFLLVGITLAVAGSQSRDDRPTRWLAISFALAAVLFLVQNLIDFSMFEVGGMFLFALLIGAAVAAKPIDENAVNTTPFIRRAIAPAMVIVVWLIVLFTIAFPIGLSESDSHTADEFRRVRRPDLAADAYARAWNRVPYNPDYAYQTARALAEGNAPLPSIRAWVDRAIATSDNMSIKAWLLSAAVEDRAATPDLTRLRTAYDTAIAIDPQAVGVRLDYADILERRGFPNEAADQIRAALTANDGLSPDEPKRLKPDHVTALEARARELEK